MTDHEIELNRVTNLQSILDTHFGTDAVVAQIDVPDPCPRFLLVQIGDGVLVHAELQPAFEGCAHAIDISESTGVDRNNVWDLDHMHRYADDRRVLGFNFLDNDGEGHDPLPDAQRVRIVPASLSSFSPGVAELVQLDLVQVGQPIWSMIELDGRIGLRLDSGDMGSIKLTAEQAQDVIAALTVTP